MDVDTQQPPFMASQKAMTQPGQVPTEYNYNQNQTQQFDSPPPPPPPEANSQHQKHQPLLDQSKPFTPGDFNESPRVDFSTNRTDDFDSPSLSRTTRTLNMRYQLFLDRIAPHWKARWTFSLLVLIIFIARVIISQGWYVICYALGIYYLNLLIGFISPKVDPGIGLNDDDDIGESMLPTRANDEFRPFIRRVPEFKFWIYGTKATLFSLFLSMFSIFDVPVFWPILLIYFLILFACTMRQQIQHMIRYSYVPWDSGKKKYASRNTDTSTNLYSPQTV